MANKETRVLKQDTLEILRQKTNEISLHVGDNEQLDALLADKTYSYTASAGQILFDGADSNRPTICRRGEGWESGARREHENGFKAW